MGKQYEYYGIGSTGGKLGNKLGRLALPLQLSGLAGIENSLSAASFALSGNEMVVDHPVNETWL